jgi:pimeloyl-ACP methyl ester carboxylesterase
LANRVADVTRHRERIAALPGSPPVVALHCSGSDGRQWHRWHAASKDRIDLIAPNLLGYGSEMPWNLERRINLFAEACEVAGLLRAHPEGVHLVGHSYGGAVALEIALRLPFRVLSLTLYEPVRFGLLRTFGDAEWHEILRVGEQMVRLALSAALERPARYFVDYWSGAGAWDRLPLARRRRMEFHVTKVCAEFDALFVDQTPLEMYDRLRMPVRLLSDTRSPRPALRVVERLSEFLPHATCARLEGLGHMGPLEAPAAVMAATGLFDSRDPSARARAT